MFGMSAAICLSACATNRPPKRFPCRCALNRVWIMPLTCGVYTYMLLQSWYSEDGLKCGGSWVEHKLSSMQIASRWKSITYWFSRSILFFAVFAIRLQPQNVCLWNITACILACTCAQASWTTVFIPLSVLLDRSAKILYCKIWRYTNQSCWC